MTRLPIRRPRHALRVLLILLPALLPAAARSQAFYPVISAEVGYTDNVAFVSDIAAEDTIYRLSVLLPVTREWRTGSFTLSYNPEYETFEKFKELDNLSHFLALNLTSDPTPRTSFEIIADLSRTQQQGGARNLDSPSLFVDRRTNRERGAASLTVRRELRNRWSWRFTTGGESTRFEEISGFDDPAPPTDLEDRTGVGASLELTRDVTRGVSVGVVYGWERFDLDVSGEETVQRAALVTRRQIGTRSELTLTTGGFRATGNTLALSTDNEETGFLGDLRLISNFRRSVMELAASHIPTLGGARLGTSVDTLLSLSLRSQGTRRATWGIYTRFARREPNGPGQSDLESRAMEIQVGRFLGRRFELSLRGSYFNQTGDLGPDDTTVYEAGLGLVWAPRGREPATTSPRSP